MRHRAVLMIVIGTLSCSPGQVSEQAFVPPAPMPPTLNAPVCARPAEEQAIDVSALVSELQVITVSCHTDDKYNAVILHLRPTLATNEQSLSSFFKRAYGRRAQTEHDKYITELANLQSMLALKSGDQFCKMYSGTFDEVMPLSSGEELATYALHKPIQQAIAVNQCGAMSAAEVKPHGAK